MRTLLSFRVDAPAFLIVITIVAAVGVLVVVAHRFSLRTAIIAAAVAAGGVLIGVLAGWLVSDVWSTFGLPLTFVTKTWIAMAFGGVAVAALGIFTRPWWRRVIAAVSIPVILLTAAAWINVDFGAYHTVSDALGIDPYHVVTINRAGTMARVADPHLGLHWHPPADMPRQGRVSEVVIPPTLSHFKARPALVYLPPAALVKNAPVLPVIVMFGGEPGNPDQMVAAGGAVRDLDAYAATHNGLAPILVLPDQLSGETTNPMCVDSPIGNSATYLLRDVPDWIRTHLKVADSRDDWAVSGFSQGGTCSIQFAAGDPALFGALLDIAGEGVPTIGADTVKLGFGGSEAAYYAAQPLTLLKKNAPFHSWAIFGWGSDDPQYGPEMRHMSEAAKAAGMTTTTVVAPSSGHDWNTVRTVLARSLPLLADHFGLGDG